MASAMREAPPVSATMPSALRSRGISAAGTREMNQTNPSPSNPAAATQSMTIGPATPSSVLDPAVCIYLVSRPLSEIIAQNSAARRQAGAASALMDRFDRPVHGLARGGGGDEGDQADLRQHRDVAQRSDREAAEQGGELLAPGANEPAARELGEREQGDGGNAADRSALQ